MDNMFFVTRLFYFWLRKRNFIFEIYLKGKVVLDVGCGDGEILQKDPQNFYGIDINPVTVGRCLAKGLNVKEANVTRIPFEDDFFDAVHCRNVIEHLEPEKARQMMAEMKRVLKTSGVIILMTPMPKTVWNSFGHIKPYPPAAIKKLFREISLESFDSLSGLKVERVFYHGIWLFNSFTFLLSTLLAVFLISFRASYFMIIKKYE